MRIAYLTAGAGGMLCGSCMRDNALVTALRAAGRDVALIPLYTPIRTDEPDVSEACVYFGGINVYLQQQSAIFRHLPFGLDRLLDRPGLLRWVLRRAGDAGGDPKTLGPLTINILLGEDGAQRREVRKLADGLEALTPCLVHLPDAMFVGLAGPLKRRLKVPVVCTLTGEDIFLDKLPPRYRDEAHRLIGEKARDVDGFICVTEYYADSAARRFGIPRERIDVVPLGVNTDPAPPDERPPAPFTIGYLARICHDKGLHVLCDAFVELRRRGRDCRLAIAGYMGEADRPYWSASKKRLRDAGAWDAVRHLGEVDFAGKRELLRSLHVLSVPTTYHEAKGLYVLEALAHGVPVVQPDHGAFPELVGRTGGGLLVPPNDPSALADAIERLMSDDAARREFGRRGREAVQRGHTAAIMAERTWAVFERHAGASTANAAVMSVAALPSEVNVA